MAGPTEEVPAAAAAAVASLKSGASEEKASPAAARPRGFWPFGEDKSVHKALGGGKSTDFSWAFPPCSESELVDCLSLIRTGILCSSFCEGFLEMGSCGSLALRRGFSCCAKFRS
jgi:hypothetical protein